MLSRAVGWPPSLERVRSLARTATLASATLLAAFHGWLFIAQAADGRLGDPWLVIRWILAAGLVAALVSVRQRGHSICSRRGLAVWLLAALLHGPAAATDVSNALASQALPETVATSLLQSLLPLSALAISLWMLAGLLGLRDRHARLYAGPVAAASFNGTLNGGFSPQCASRPPPPRR
jgi:hypothetical protein